MWQRQHIQYATTFLLFDFTLPSRKSQTKWNPVFVYNCNYDDNNNINTQIIDKGLKTEQKSEKGIIRYY
jgi:hypothetical protein